MHGVFVLPVLADSDSATIVTLLVLFGLAMVVLVFYGPVWWMRRKVLAGVLRVVEELIEGRVDRRADPTARGQLGRLARAVNQLAAMQETRQNRAQQDNANLSALQEYTSDLVIITDEDDRIVLINPAGAELLERPREAILGQAFSRVFGQKELLELYRSAYSSATPLSRQLPLTTPRRPLQCEATATTLYEGPRYRGTLVILRDLTEVTNAIQMKTDFASNASHELRTPLASIRAAVDTIQEAWPDLQRDPGGPDTQTIKRCVDIIGGHALRLQLMVQDLLDLSRTEDPRAVVRMDRVDLSHVAELVMGMYAGLAGPKNVALQVELAEDARAMRGDERLIILMLKNLVDNSIKFTAAGGRVVIRSYRAQGAEESSLEAANGHAGGNGVPVNGAAILAHPAQSFLVLEVADSGCGIPPEDQQRVFERFYTVNRSRGGADRGTGLGLAIVKHAVAAMNGSVRLESEVQQGTTIRCFFPCAVGTDAVLETVNA